MLALAHGTNDAQKTMGVITLALVAHGTLSATDPEVPGWVVVSSATALALGTYMGGWRIIRTVGSRILKMDAAQGFSAQGAGAAVVLAASHAGVPLSTTHVISGGVVGAGAAKRVSAVRWGVAGNIVAAWVLTVPAAGLIGALVYGVTTIFGDGALGPGLVLAALALASARLLQRRRRPMVALPA
jgi:PiT family inorganic phosphate transporter